MVKGVGGVRLIAHLRTAKAGSAVAHNFIVASMLLRMRAIGQIFICFSMVERRYEHAAGGLQSPLSARQGWKDSCSTKVKQHG